MMKFLMIAWRNMWRNWRRTAIALTAIILGMVLLIFMEGSVQGSDQAIFGNAVRLYGGNVQIHADGFRAKASRMPLYPLADPDAVVETALADETVNLAYKRIQTGGMASTKAGTFPVSITALEPAEESQTHLMATNISKGRFLLPDEGDAIVIGQGLAELLAVDVGDRIDLVGRSSDNSMRLRTMTIVGIYDLGMSEAEEGLVFITLNEAQTLYNLRDQVTEVALTLQKVGQETKLVPQLQNQLPGYEVDAWDTLRSELRTTMDTKAQFTTIFGIVVLLIASIGILNLMLMAAFERTREMGVLAALGMKGRQIMGLFLLEGMLMGIIGGVVGAILGWLLIWAVNQGGGIPFAAGQDMGEITALMGDTIYPSVTLAYIINRTVIVIVIAMLASLYPAWQASRRQPAEALHHI